MSLITSENQIVCFPSFVLTVFWYSTSYTVTVVLWKMLMEPVNAPARWLICKWIYPRCDGRLPAIAGNSAWSCRFFACDCAGIFSCVCSYFCLRLAGFLPAILMFLPVSCMYFASRSRQFCMLVAGKFAWVPHVKLPVKCLWFSGKFTCTRSQFACVLREVLAASKQVNLPVFTGKLHVTQVNCARDLFTCELHVKLPAFAGNFARASFTV